MALARVTYVADGATTQFVVPFPYISKTHVKVYQNGSQLFVTGQYTWLDDSTINFRTAPGSGDEIQIIRETSPGTRLVDYQQSALLREADLDADSKQAFYLAQENRDLLGAAVEAAVARIDGGLYTPAISLEDLIDSLAQEVVSSSIADNLQQRITDIDLNAESIIANENRIVTVEADVSGLEARYGVTLNVNGYITGFEQFNDGTSGTFAILADNFYIVDPANDGQNPVVPFAVTGGVVYMQNVVIQDAVIEDLSVGKLTAGVLQAQVVQDADILAGTGRIIWDNGSYVKAAGVGFGTSNQFLEWFGPRPTGGDVDLCDEASAIQYVKTDGSAYFGGSLSAGTLSNSGSTSSLSQTAEITVGPFGTNGNDKDLTLTYDGSYSGVLPTDPGPDHSTEIIVDVYRDIGGAGETLVKTLTLNGTCFHSGFDSEVGGYPVQWILAGSVSWTDNDATVDDFTYRAVISTFDTGGHGPSFQRITLISVEQ